MKTLKLTALFLALGTITIVGQSALAETNQKIKNVTFVDSFLDLSGVMTINGEKVSGYSVFIFQDGSPSDTFEVNNRLEQHYLLPINHHYALKFTRPGCKDRLLLVDAHINDKKILDVYTFRYDISFIQEDASNTFDDFPVAFVHYDTEKKDFDYNRKYHSNVRTDLPSNTNTAGTSNKKNKNSN